jgi:ATP-dependent 26S proteasome regulatory subunit
MLLSQIKLGHPAIWIKTADVARSFDSILKFSDRKFYTIDPILGFSEYVNNSWKQVIVEFPNPQDPTSTIESTTFDNSVALDYIFTSLKEKYIPVTFVSLINTKPSDDLMSLYAGLISILNNQYRNSFWQDDLSKMPMQLMVISPFSCNEDYSHLFYSEEYEYPNLEELATIVNHINDSTDTHFASQNEVIKIAKSALGMTESEFINVCLNSILENGNINSDYVYNIKMADIKKNGILEIIRPKVTFDNIGGLDNIKSIIQNNARLWNNPDKAKEFGISPIRRMLMVGIPGTGKSAICEATANALGLDLARTGVSQVMNSFIGQSEANMRAVFKQINIMAPLCVWIDEFGRDLSGGASSSHVDGGTTDRVHGEFLTGLQELPENVFLMCAANQLEHLKPEMLRADRFDKIMFVGLPSFAERVDILKIYLSDIDTSHNFNYEEIANATQYFTGAEIKALIKEIKFNVAVSEMRTIDTKDIVSFAPSMRNILWNKSRQMIQDLYATAIEQWDWASNDQLEDAKLILPNRISSPNNSNQKQKQKQNAFSW